jgi:DNA-binding transcriptional LysR family regulator
MDIDLLRSFLEISRTRHFGKAADNLCITQSAISARIRQLEDYVGSSLFTRTRNNIQLTAAGQKLLPYCENIVNTWNRARQEIALKNESQIGLSIAGVPSLWDIVLQEWLQKSMRHFPNLSIYAEVFGQETLIQKLMDRSLDIAFMFEEPQLSRLEVHEVYSIDLVMVSSDPAWSLEEALEKAYILVDWGTSFAMKHAKAFPELLSPRLRVGLGRIAKSYILDSGGAAYLARTMVEDELQSGKLHIVPGAPVIERKTYASFATKNEKQELIVELLSLLG